MRTSTNRILSISLPQMALNKAGSLLSFNFGAPFFDLPVHVYLSPSWFVINLVKIRWVISGTSLPPTFAKKLT